jgi:predicted anti-sigma-YlaC factor YlaD
MKCKTAEKWVLRSLDGRQDERSRDLVEEHLASCASCRRAAAEYGAMVALLREGRGEAPLPRFWERLEPRLREERKVVPLVLWERWCLRAIPVFLTLVAVAAGLFLFTPQAGEMSQSEVLLLENANPFTEARTLFEQRHSDDRNMMLIFASLDDKPAAGRKLP